MASTVLKSRVDGKMVEIEWNIYVFWFKLITEVKLIRFKFYYIN